MNTDSLTKARPAKGIFRYDNNNYQSRFLGKEPGSFSGKGQPDYHLLFSTDNIMKAKTVLKEAGYAVTEKKGSIFFTDRFSIVSELSGP